ncbi:MAG: epoxyqueuosine reductase QueH [Patescibacteria group bacterium]
MICITKILLHACCAPCGAYVIEELKKRGFEVAVYYCNPNVYPCEEYVRRRDESVRYCAETGIEMIEGEYDHRGWLGAVKGLEREPEGGARCRACYRLRLLKTAEMAKKEGCQWFGTTLSISPHKDSSVINEIGAAVGREAGVQFLAEDWKLHDGFKKSCEISRAHQFYRQTYCGCEFSMRKKS